jgi:outer membrane protein TolC
MYRKAALLVTRRSFRSALLAAVLLAAGEGAARADEVRVGWRMLTQDGGGGAAAQPAPPPTLADVAGGPRAVTLPELLALAIRQAPALQLAEIDIAIAEAQFESSQAIDDWLIGADLRASTTARSQSISGGATATRALPPGTTIALHAQSSWSQSEFVTDMFSGTLEEYTDEVTLSITQRLLEGRDRSVNRAAEARARIARDSAALGRQRDAIGVVRDVVSAYWELALAQRDLEIRKSSLVLAQERLRRTQAAIKGGGIAATEALAVEQVIAQREEEILGAELAVIERSIAVRRLVGLEIGPGELVLSVPTELGVPLRSWQLDSVIADAYNTSPELALLVQQEKGATIEVEVTENGVLPSLDLALSFGPVGIDDRPAGALENMATFEDLSAIATLTFEHSIGNHGAKGAARQARAERLKIKIDTTDARAQIAEALAQAVVLAESASRRIEIAGRAIGLAEQNIVAEQARFGLGKATNFDVLLRQEELKEAQLRQARATIDWHKAANLIAAISGSLLVDYGISLPE